MSFKQFTKELGNNQAEGAIVKTIFVSLLSSIIIFALLYLVKLRYIADFIPNYAFTIFFAILSYAIILPAVQYVQAYRQFSCTSGMMIGMTIGMVSGFLPGFFIGATNGMFYGSVFGMAIGILLGIWNGKCCGVMGVMEGIMAGFMGGLMGAMSAVMMLNDHLKAAAIIIFIISAVILLGLKYMVYTETRSVKAGNKDSAFFTIFWSVLLTLLTIAMMVFGPRSFLFQ
jgi:hypothetical protein